MSWYVAGACVLVYEPQRDGAQHECLAWFHLCSRLQTADLAVTLQSAIRCHVAGHAGAMDMCHEVVDFMQQTGEQLDILAGQDLNL